MYAIVEIAGMQLKVENGMKIWVPYMENHDEGEKFTFDRVLLIADDSGIKVGKPLVDGAFIETTLVNHAKGPKLVVFKKRRRTGYNKKRGHRQHYSVLKIDNIKM
ncbi:50S ribosomal protein L21 [bacterium]|nr:50S ribosomal protein L21 [bacterium]